MNNKKINPFIEGENIGRELLKEWCSNNGTVCNLSDKIDCSIDAILECYGLKFIAEIKVRDSKYRGYSTVFLEEAKANSIYKEVLKNDCRDGLLFNFIGDKELYIFTIKDIISCRTRNILMNKTTAIDTGKKRKRVYDIPKTMGTKYIKINNVWNRVK